MTREEAIIYLKSADVTVGQEIKTKTAEALEMAIKTLEQEPTTKNDLAQERYQDLIEYFGGEDIVLKDRKEFKAWLERVKWHVKRADELARELEQIKGTTKENLGVDAVSRDEVCRYVAEFVNHEFSTREEEELIDNIITGIEHLPSVTPQEPRKGHWIESMPGGAEEWCYKCSECNFWKYKKTINLSKFNFCPNCGVKMEVDE